MPLFPFIPPFPQQRQQQLEQTNKHETDLPPPATIKDALRNGINFFSKIQTEDGGYACSLPLNHRKQT